jgi:two-component system cell cycle sensor histidine kinase/response regulator CckA
VPDDIRLLKLLRAYCKASALAVAGVGCLVLCGWAFHIGFLTSVLPGLVTMKANTALGLMLAAASLWLLLPGQSHARRNHAAHFFALLVVLIGAATLCEYIFVVDLRIDQLLFRDPMGSKGTFGPGRPAPMTATALVTIGLALMLLDWRSRWGRRPTQLLSLWTGLISMLAITGYIFHATILYRLLLYTQVALHTAAALLLLSVAVFFARPRSDIAGDLTGHGSGSVMARRFLPAVFCIPLFLGWILLQGQLAGLYGTELGLALYCTANTIVFAVLVWLSARKMNEEYLQLSKAEIEIRELNSELEGRVAERTKSLVRQAAVLSEQAALLDLAQDAIVVLDMQNRISFWNRGAEALYGWTADEAIGRNKYEFLKTEFSHPLETMEATLLQLGFWEGEAIHHRRDGTRLTVASRWSLQRDEDGTPLRILTINNDITDRRRMEERLRQSHKMEAVGQLAAGVAHEFNNLLQALMSMAAIVRLRAGNPQVATIGAEMEGQIRHGARLTQQLLQFSQGQPIELTNLDLGEQVRTAGILLRQLIPENIRIVVATSPERLSVEGDAAKVQQVLLNLAINARDAMPAGGTLTLRTGSSDGEVFLEVEDTGEGIDEATRTHLFEPFFTTKEQGKGTGLGLAEVHGIVAEHGGRIDVDSGPGQGCRFRVIFPASASESLPAPEPEADVDWSQGTGRVLLVEDQEGVRAGITMLLEMIGYEVTAAASAEEAMAMVIEPPPDLLLSDITLPGIAGPELGERLVERWPSLKVVLMSGYIEEASRASASRREWQFLQKPFEVTDLALHLRAALDGKAPGSASANTSPELQTQQQQSAAPRKSRR